MNVKTMGLLAVALLAGPMAVDAQTVTYDFSTSVPGLGATMVSSVWTFATGGAFSETLQVTNPNGQNLYSYSGTGTWLYGPGDGVGPYLAARSSNSMGETDEFTAAIDPGELFSRPPLPTFNLGIPDIGGQFHASATVGYDYDGEGRNVGGPVTSAPEIDPASCVSGLTLLLGGLVALRGRRPANRAVA